MVVPCLNRQTRFGANPAGGGTRRINGLTRLCRTCRSPRVSRLPRAMRQRGRIESENGRNDVSPSLKSGPATSRPSHLIHQYEHGGLFDGLHCMFKLQLLRLGLFLTWTQAVETFSQRLPCAASRHVCNVSANTAKSANTPSGAERHC